MFVENVKGAKQMHAENTECSEDDNMVAMEQKLAAQASRSDDPPPSTCRQSEPVAERQESPAESRLPLPDQSPTPCTRNGGCAQPKDRLGNPENSY